MNNIKVTPQISIVIPVYNTPKKLLHRCIDNILDQTLQSFEVIIVDDGSLEETASILDKYEKEDSRFHIFHQQNSGVSAARNKGIKYAKGKYITFVDADDVIDKDFLSIAFALAEENHLDIVYGAVRKCVRLDDYHEISDNKFKFELYEKDEIWKVQRLLLLNDCVEPFYGMNYLDLGPYGKLFRRNIINGILFPEDISLGEDQVFNHRVLKNCKICAICNKTAYYYINNEESASHKWIPDAVSIMMRAMREIKKCLQEDNKELINAFYISVLINLFVAISIQFYGTNSPYKGYRQRRRETLKALNDPLIKAARKKASFAGISHGNKNTKIKVILMRSRLHTFYMECKLCCKQGGRLK